MYDESYRTFISKENNVLLFVLSCAHKQEVKSISTEASSTIVEDVHLMINEPNLFFFTEEQMKSSSFLLLFAAENWSDMTALEECVAEQRELSPERCARGLLANNQIAPSTEYFMNCPSGDFFQVQLEQLLVEEWGHLIYVLGKTTPTVSQQVCAGKTTPWQHGKLEHPRLSAKTFTSQQQETLRQAWERTLMEQCETDGYSDLSASDCQIALTEAMRSASIVRYEATLPDADELAVITLRNHCNWAMSSIDSGAVLTGVASINGEQIHRMLSFSAPVCPSQECSALKGIGDTNGDGFSDVLIDLRGEFTMGAICLLEWVADGNEFHLAETVCNRWFGG